MTGSEVERQPTNGGWVVLVASGLLVLGGAFVVIQLVNFYSMGLDLKEQAQWTLCSPNGLAGDGSCIPEDDVPSMWPFSLGGVFVGIGIALLVARIVYGLRAHTREVTLTQR